MSRKLRSQHGFNVLYDNALVLLGANSWLICSLLELILEKHLEFVFALSGELTHSSAHTVQAGLRV